MENQIVVTNEGLKKLKDELDYLKNVKREEVIKALGTARSFGDLSENSEYDEAKNEQSKVEGRIQELEEILKNVVVISEDQIHTDSVNVGARVKVKNENGVETVYTIVGPTEVDRLAKKISDQSPIGKALMGKKIGATVSIEAPAGTINLEIIEIMK